MEFNTLAIFTDCVHFFDNDKNVVTENHIFRRQMQALATLFQHTIIYCPFADYSKDKVTSVYENPSIQFEPLPNVGGNTLNQAGNVNRICILCFKVLPPTFGNGSN